MPGGIRQPRARPTGATFRPAAMALWRRQRGSLGGALGPPSWSSRRGRRVAPSVAACGECPARGARHGPCRRTQLGQVAGAVVWERGVGAGSPPCPPETLPLVSHAGFADDTRPRMRPNGPQGAPYSRTPQAMDQRPRVHRVPPHAGQRAAAQLQRWRVPLLWLLPPRQTRPIPTRARQSPPRCATAYAIDGPRSPPLPRRRRLQPSPEPTRPHPPLHPRGGQGERRRTTSATLKVSAIERSRPASITSRHRPRPGCPPMRRDFTRALR